MNERFIDFKFNCSYNLSINNFNSEAGGFMRKLIEMQEGTVLVAVDVPEELLDEDDFKKVSIREWFKKDPEKVDNKFSAISGAIANCSKPIIESIKMMQEEEIPPKKASAEFGLSFTGKGNIYLVESSAEATIKVSFEWELGDCPSGSNG